MRLHIAIDSGPTFAYKEWRNVEDFTGYIFMPELTSHS